VGLWALALKWELALKLVGLKWDCTFEACGLVNLIFEACGLLALKLVNL
jgi:hypothetical protein